MQCPECHYISFKIGKACEACGFKFKKNHKRDPLSPNKSLSFFDLFPVKKETIQEKRENSVEGVGVLEAPERESFINPETGDFNLDLFEIEDNKIEIAQGSSDPNKESPDFDLNEDIYPEKIDETKSIEIEPNAIEESANSDETSFLEPAMENGQPVTPELDLGENEIKLDLSYEPIQLNEPNSASSSSDLPNLDLEIDNSNGSFITKSNEIAEIEIEDLDLELESSDEPEKDKS